MISPFFDLVSGNSPIVGVALHNGHDIREELQPYVNLNEADRLREEDPYTGAWANLIDNRIIVHKSRFELDLNRSREKAVYLSPDDAWGLAIWKKKLPRTVVSQSLHFYDHFYSAASKALQSIYERHGFLIVLDIHSYNHRRNGPKSLGEDPEQNPDINIGTSNMHRERWAPVVEGFIHDLRQSALPGKNVLDVRENIKFKGGHFSQWVHQKFPGSSCSISIEYKKIFMDEWTGKLDLNVHQALKNSLYSAIPRLIENCKKILEHA